MNAIDRLDRVIHEPARLKIMTHLYVVESGDFVYLMRTTGLTRGNLSSHMTKLEDAGYVEVIKEFVERKPVTMLSLTEEGRTALLEYRKYLTLAIEDSD
ncbi:MAG: transcriptional regulator [Halieaceae bacterium]|nr:transcriptional regulator [Halieaceae bacterium]